jgi:hypothetical protein
MGDEELHGVVAPPYLGHARQRSEEPAAEQSRARSGFRDVDLREERPSLDALDGSRELEVILRRVVEEERVAERIEHEATHGQRPAGLAFSGQSDAARSSAACRDGRARGGCFTCSEDRVQDIVGLRLTHSLGDAPDDNTPARVV